MPNKTSETVSYPENMDLDRFILQMGTQEKLPILNDLPPQLEMTGKNQGVNQTIHKVGQQTHITGKECSILIGSKVNEQGKGMLQNSYVMKGTRDEFNMNPVQEWMDRFRETGHTPAILIHGRPRQTENDIDGFSPQDLLVFARYPDLKAMCITPSSPYGLEILLVKTQRTEHLVGDELKKMSRRSEPEQKALDMAGMESLNETIQVRLKAAETKKGKSLTDQERESIEHQAILSSIHEAAKEAEIGVYTREKDPGKPKKPFTIVTG